MLIKFVLGLNEEKAGENESRGSGAEQAVTTGYLVVALLGFLTFQVPAHSHPTITTVAPLAWGLLSDNDTSAANYIDDSDDAPMRNLGLPNSPRNEDAQYTTDAPYSTTEVVLTEAPPTFSPFYEDPTSDESTSLPALVEVEPIFASPTEAPTSESPPAHWTTPPSEEEATTVQSRENSGRSLMVVLPYSTNNLTENRIQELYTKAPLTRIIGNQGDYFSIDEAPSIRPTEAPTTTPTPSTTLASSTSTTTPSLDLPAYESTRAPARRKPIRRPHPSRRRPLVPINHKPEYTEATIPTTSTRRPTTPTSVKSTTPLPMSTQGPMKPSVSPPIRDNVKDLLASIGLSPMAGLQPVMPTFTRSTKKRTTTTTTPVPDQIDVSGAAESLTPEMKDILKSIGLLHETSAAPSLAPPTMSSPTITTQPIVPEVDPSSYIQFKPLPMDASSSRDGVKVSGDMQEFLASFGLLPNVGPIRITSTPDEYFDINEMSKNRKSKALKTDSVIPPLVEMPLIHPEMFTQDQKDVLGDLGLMDGHKEEANAATTRDHIFNPVEHAAKLGKKGEAEKVVKLLTSIKNASEDELRESSQAVTAEAYKTPKFRPKSKRRRKPVKENLEQNDGPSPLSLEELRMFYANSKNEVKRQQPTEDSSSASSTTEEPFFPEDFTQGPQTEPSSTSASSTTTTEATTTTTTVAPPSASADMLADSFGGQGDIPKGGSELPPARPNGLYFLLDWNTFFNVGEPDKNPVTLNFSPRIGDPKRFIPITVP